MQIRSRGLNFKTSTYKMMLVVPVIRGQRADKAVNQLVFNKRRPAKGMLEVLEDAIEKAQRHFGLSATQLYVGA